MILGRICSGKRQDTCNHHCYRYLDDDDGDDDDVDDGNDGDDGNDDNDYDEKECPVNQ